MWSHACRPFRASGESRLCRAKVIGRHSGDFGDFRAVRTDGKGTGRGRISAGGDCDRKADGFLRGLFSRLEGILVPDPEMADFP